MKKVLVLLSAVLVSGCFICHKGEPQEEIIVPEVVQQQPPAPKANVIVRHSFSEVANFAFDSKTAQADIDKMDDLDRDIKAHPEAVILVEGYTDSIGTGEYNENLSLERARSVAAILEKQGYPNQIRIHGAGASSPIASNATQEGRAQNRRVDVILLKSETK